MGQVAGLQVLGQLQHSLDVICGEGGAERQASLLAFEMPWLGVLQSPLLASAEPKDHAKVTLEATKEKQKSRGGFPVLIGSQPRTFTEVKLAPEILRMSNHIFITLWK